MGLVTVALLTLAPLALRPVRLACLIHAANVHSEPGSNPSKIAGSRPAPRWVEDKLRSRRTPRGRSPTSPARCARPADRDVRRRRDPHDAAHAGFPQGLTLT